MNMLCVPSIAVLVYFLISLYKETIAVGREKYLRVIPMIAGLMGLGLGILVFYTTPHIIHADNIIEAMIIGLTSGLAATGTNQIFKQLNNGKKTNGQVKKD